MHCKNIENYYNFFINNQLIHIHTYSKCLSRNVHGDKKTKSSRMTSKKLACMHSQSLGTFGDSILLFLIPTKFTARKMASDCCHIELLSTFYTTGIETGFVLMCMCMCMGVRRCNNDRFFTLELRAYE